MTSVSAHDESKATYSPPIGTTPCESAIEARSPVSACRRKQSLESWLTSAPGVCSADASNQPTCWETIERKAAARTSSASRSVMMANNA